jgi:hypothetical protein
MVALGKLMKYLKKKRPEIVEGDWFFQWDSVPVYTTTIVRSWLYLPGLALIDFFLLRKVKEELAGLHLFQESLKNAWEGVLWSLPPP